jgi:PST family polysaccharide transporter/lipopolysaccharide exporter
VLQILTAEGVARALAGTTGPLFRAVGRPDLATKLALGRLAILAVILYPLTTRWGLEGVAVGILASSLLFHGAALRLATRIAAVTSRDVLRVLAPPAAHTGIAAAVVWAVQPAAAEGGLPWLLAAATLGAATYVLATAVAGRLYGYDGVRLLLEGARTGGGRPRRLGRT